jgi:hypothetical protein
MFLRGKSLVGLESGASPQEPFHDIRARMTIPALRWPLSLLFISWAVLGACSSSGGTAKDGAAGAGGHGDDAARPSDGSLSDTSASGCDGPCTVTFASGTDWMTYGEDPDSNPSTPSLGAAQPVCANATTPASCPAGALVYGFPSGGWTASLATIPGAAWIWGAGIADGDPADLVRFYFARSFTLGATPSGKLSIGADDFAEVRVNGVVVGSIGSVTDFAAAGAAQSTLTAFDLTSKLVAGRNTITVAAQNGPASFSTCSPCTYSGNTAGVVFGGSLSSH